MWLMFITMFNADMEPVKTIQSGNSYPTHAACMKHAKKVEKDFDRKGVYAMVLCDEKK
jgi:hypothetical protein